MFKISLIGAGNMAWQLARVCKQQKWPVAEVYSRNLDNADALSKYFELGEATNQLDFTKSTAHVFLLCIADQAMEDVLTQLRLPTEGLLVHTSGSQPMSLLAKYHSRVGVFYPFQTVTKGKVVNFKSVPFCLESSESSDLDLLKEMASALSDRVYEIDSASRKKLHLAAVFACNFVNHLLALSQDVLQASNMELGMLAHLVHETIDKAFTMNPDDAQTGPAVRGDQNIINQHQEMLGSDSNAAKLYKVLSESIMERYGKK